jgi:predicted HTH domain antitoxin
MVQITVQVPNDVADSLGANREETERQALESIAVEGYRSKRLSRGQVRQMLGLGWAETEEFLAVRKCDRHYTMEDLENDRQTLAGLPLR